MSQRTIHIAAALLVGPDGRTLLVRKAGTTAFMQPGGKIEPGETPEQALVREIAEELGLTLDALELLCVVDLVTPEEGAHWVSPTYLAASFDGEPVLLEPEKHTGLGWFPLNALPDPLASSALAAAAALRSRGIG